MPTRNVNLTGHFDEFIEQLVESGHYKNASEVMRAGLRLLEQQSREESEKLKVLRSLAGSGFDELDQGQGSLINSDNELKNWVAQVGRDVARRGSSKKRSGQ
ncbi:MAG: type II toxin-antitoxin system ParD family antitoxin [Pirellulales bacterium]|nr:type II toxin-antitoxin system ParD family antitoxin [Pirellulales bacterium]